MMMNNGVYAGLVRMHVGQAPAPVPHKCTARSAAAIAAQIDPAWTYSHSLPPGHGYRCVSTTREYDVVTPQGPKRIPATFCADMMLLKCPYTGETFAFNGGTSPRIDRPRPVEPQHVGQAPAPAPPAPTCPAGQGPAYNGTTNTWSCAPTWGSMSFAQKFEAGAFLFAFIAIFLVLSVGVAIFGSPA